MSDGVAITLITQAGLLIVGILTVIRQQLHDKSTAEKRHVVNTDKLEKVTQGIKEIEKELPQGGLKTWVDTIKNHTQALTEQTSATTELAGSLDRLETRVDVLDATVEKLQGGGLA